MAASHSFAVTGPFFQAGRTARFAGSDGSGPQFEYGPPATIDAGREAWVTGGGGDAQVTYGRAR